MPVTFAVDNVEPEDLRKHQGASSALDALKHCRKGTYVKEFLVTSFGARNGPAIADSNQRAVVPSTNGFIYTVMRAFSDHHHLSIRPDDVWLCIMSQLSLFVNANAEAMRDRFVSHDGQKTLLVRRMGTRFTVEWDGIIQLTIEKQAEHGQLEF